MMLLFAIVVKAKLLMLTLLCVNSAKYGSIINVKVSRAVMFSKLSNTGVLDAQNGRQN